MNPVTDLTLTQPVATVPIGTLSFDHDGVGLDRFMLGYEIDGVWTNLEPRPAAEFGAGPYEATVAIRTGITWRVIPMDADGVTS